MSTTGTAGDFFNDACPVALRAVFADLIQHFGSGTWLAQSNRYQADVDEAVHADAQGVQHTQLAQYIAASAVIHCVDGWSYLGRAIDGHLRGDSDVARHLAYYAELRAAKAILASEGVGIFHRRHFAVHAKEECREWPKETPTHLATWKALQAWADMERSSLLLKRIIKPAGIGLGDWLAYFGPGAITQITPVGREWLLQWGIDLRHLAEDKRAREYASYGPTAFWRTGTMSTADRSRFACQMWRVFEPGQPDRFGLLDRHLLRMSLRTIYRGMTETGPDEREADSAGGQPFPTYEEMVTGMVGAVSPGGLPHASWVQFLLGRVQPDDPEVVTCARQTSSIGDPSHHVQMISRAALLLRVATGACENLLSGRADRDDLRFWWSDLGLERGLWSSDAEPEDITDLWMDVASALEDVATWESEVASGEPSQQEWKSGCANALCVLGECERIGLWGLGL